VKGVLAFFFEDDAIRLVYRTPSGAVEPLRVLGEPRQRLLFLPTPEEVRNDAFVVERLEAADPAVIADFYRAIGDSTRVVTRYGSEYPVIACLDPILEQVHQAWRDVAGGSSDLIDACCLFAPGIPESACEIIREHFRSNRFRLIGDFGWYDCLLSALRGTGQIGNDSCLVAATAAFNNLRYEYIEWRDGIQRREFTELEGYGDEPRIFILADLAVRGFARKKQSQLLNDESALKQEVARYLRQARREITRFEHGELRASVHLSDGNAGSITIEERDLNKQVGPKYKYLRDELKKFISRHSNLVRTEHILLAAKALDTKECRDDFAREFGATKLVSVASGIEDLLNRGLQVRLASLAEAKTGLADRRMAGAAAGGTGTRGAVVMETPSAPVLSRPPMPVTSLPPLPGGGKRPVGPPPLAATARPPEAPAARTPTVPRLPVPAITLPPSGRPAEVPTVPPVFAPAPSKRTTQDGQAMIPRPIPPPPPIPSTASKPGQPTQSKIATNRSTSAAKTLAAPPPPPPPPPPKSHNSSEKLDRA